jgi:outer membrane lipoprotein-sorting protein
MTRLNARSLSLLLMMTATVAGCGHTSPSAPAPRPERPQPMPAPVASPPSAPGATDGAPLLAGLRQTFLACKGIEAEVTSYSEGRFKMGKPVSELRKNTSRSKLIWAKPSRMRGEIVETDNFLVSGARMVSTDGQTITVKAGGFLGFLPLKVKASDDMLASNRDHRFGDMTPNVLLSWIMGPEAVWTVIGDSRVKGVPVKLVRVTNIKHLDAGIDEERIAIEPGTFAVRNLAMYDNGKKVVDYTFNKFRWNPAITSETFKL